MVNEASAEINVSRQIRQSIARFPDDASTAETLLFKMATISAISSLENEKLKVFLLPLARAL